MSPSTGCARIFTYAAVALVALVARTGYAQVAPAANGRMSMEELEQHLEQMQRELQVLRERDHERQDWEESIVKRLPPLDDAGDEPHVYSTSASAAVSGTAKSDSPPVADFAKSIKTLSTDCGDITFKPGLRLQPRYEYDAFDGNNDFFIRRFRLKGSGAAFDIARYGAELKIDSTSKFEGSPSAVVENAWLDFTLLDDLSYLRAGLYDLPFSRNALTSDSKLLLMDRTLIFDALAANGLADNTVGVMFHGRPWEGLIEYDVGVFDNFTYEKFGSTGTREADQVMPAGRIVLNLFDPATPPEAYADYQGSYIGKGQRLQIGANAAQLGNAVDGADEFDLNAWGADVFFNTGPFVVQAEYDWFEKHRSGANTLGDGWYVQGGYLLNHCQYLCCACHYAIELAARYQTLDANSLSSSDELRWTSLGLNFYIRDHNLKIQTDYTFKREEVVQIDNDEFKVQLQIDF